MLNKRKQELKNMEYEMKTYLLDLIKQEKGSLTLSDYDKVNEQVKMEMSKLQTNKNNKLLKICLFAVGGYFSIKAIKKFNFICSFISQESLKQALDIAKNQTITNFEFNNILAKEILKAIKITPALFDDYMIDMIKEGLIGTVMFMIYKRK